VGENLFLARDGVIFSGARRRSLHPNENELLVPHSIGFLFGLETFPQLVEEDSSLVGINFSARCSDNALGCGASFLLADFRHEHGPLSPLTPPLVSLQNPEGLVAKLHLSSPFTTTSRSVPD
jgi:hypothetical protein